MAPQRLLSCPAGLYGLRTFDAYQQRHWRTEEKFRLGSFLWRFKAVLFAPVRSFKGVPTYRPFD
ncbi:MAG: hypothetical protein JWP08_3234 [Bryobacterales bacterium]|nr:hypothetical protein [Bryobacterales bacterium]